jgi:hypothetical protein
MPDSTRNADFPVVPLKVKQHIKAAARSIGAVSATARQLATEIHNDQQEIVNNIKQQIQPQQIVARQRQQIVAFPVSR